MTTSLKKPGTPIASVSSTQCSSVSLLGDGTEKFELCCFQMADRQVRLLTTSSSQSLLETLIAASTQPSGPVSEKLGGRATIIPFVSEGDDSFVLKSYQRGGVLRRVLPKDIFLGWGEERSERELRALLTARSLGVSVPTPVGTITTRGMFRREWLIMEALPTHRTLATIAVNEEKSGELSEPLEQYLRVVVEQIEKLIAAGILHIDLHPGNVVVSSTGDVFLIDFDHAVVLNQDERMLRERYIRRWRRAVIKHELPEILSEIFCALLRRKVEARSENTEGVGEPS